MIHTARQSPKFLRLVRCLRQLVGRDSIVDAESVAVAILERLWHATIVGAKRGDIGRFENDVIAEMVGWMGDPDELVGILTETGWLDECDTYRLVIHDWSHHAPNHVKGVVSRSGGFIATPTQGSGPGSQPRVADQVANPGSATQGPLPPNLTQPNQTKPNQTKQEESLSSEMTDAPSVQEFFDRWNRFAAKTPKIKACRKLTAERKRKIATRLKDPGWFSDFKEAVLGLPLGGDGWQPTLDWLIRNEHNAYRIMEGDFDWRAKDDPAAIALAAKRRKNAYEERQAREQWEKQQRKDDGRKNPISDTWTQANGSEGETAGDSLLFGGEEDFAVSGAEHSRTR